MRPIRISHSGASGRKSKPGNSRRIQLAVSSQAVHRSPAKMNSGTPARVCTHCMIRGVGRATLNVFGKIVEFGRLGLDGVGHLPQPRKIVDVGHRELGSACADARDELRGGERAAAELEEVGVLVRRADAEDGDPLLGEPRRGARQVGVARHPCRSAATGATPCRPCPTCGPGRSSTTASSGISGAGRVCASSARAVCRSKPSAGTT